MGMADNIQTATQLKMVASNILGIKLNDEDAATIFNILKKYQRR